jgi:hypothetical protein
MLAEKQMQAFLTRHGIGEATFMSFGHGTGGQMVFSEIRLDPDGFSTIGAITARVRWPYLLSAQPFSEIIINKLDLTGELDGDGRVTFAGFNPVALFPLVETDSFVLDNGKIDLATTAGDVRIDVKVRMTRQPGGSQKIEAALFSNQQEFSLDSRWDAKIATDGKWTTAADLRDIRLELPNLAMSRVSGWLSMEGSISGISAMNGQFDAGQVRIGDKTILTPARLTTDGPYNGGHLILHGDVKNYAGMVVTAEIRHDGDGAFVTASVDARKIDELISFLTNLHQDMQKAFPRSSALTTLLLTPGNLDRIRAEAETITYDSVVLNIEGPAGNLSGKISLRWNGRSTGQIAMSPGER